MPAKCKQSITWKMERKQQGIFGEEEKEEKRQESKNVNTSGRNSCLICAICAFPHSDGPTTIFAFKN